MTREQLISALMEECRTERGTVEDFLFAFGDIAVVAFGKDKSFPLPGIGWLQFMRNGARPQVRFHIEPALGNRLGIAEKQLHGPLCIRCGKRPRRPRRKMCAACEHRIRREKGKK